MKRKKKTMKKKQWCSSSGAQPEWVQRNCFASWVEMETVSRLFLANPNWKWIKMCLLGNEHASCSFFLGRCFSSLFYPLLLHNDCMLLRANWLSRYRCNCNLLCVCVSLLICIEEEDNQGQIECKHADSTNKSWKGASALLLQQERERGKQCMEIVFLPQTKNSIASIEVCIHTVCCVCTHHVRRWPRKVWQKKYQSNNSNNNGTTVKTSEKKAEKLI